MRTRFPNKKTSNRQLYLRDESAKVVATGEELVGRWAVMGFVFFAFKLAVRTAFVDDMVLHDITTATAIRAVADRVATRVVRDKVVLLRISTSLTAITRSYS